MSRRERNVRKKKSKGKKLIIFLIVVILLVVAGFMLAKKVHDMEGNWLAVFLGHNEETLKNLDEIKVLILGVSGGNTDTIIACSYNPKQQTAAMLSIPRDTFVGKNKSSSSASNKINSLYLSSGPEKTVEAVNNLTGLDIQYYVVVDTKALIKFVDLIGGIDFNVPINMNYDDYSQDLHIHLEEGEQHLTGEQVEGLVRFRHNNNGSTYSYEYGIEDYGRMKTQREVIKTVAATALKVKNVKELGNIINLYQEYVKTNMNVETVKDYIPYVTQMNFNSIKTEQLPGASSDKNGGVWFFFNDEEETESIVKELFFPEIATVTTEE